MFQRFTHSARRVVVLAQEEARLLDHTYIGTEHLLLGLINEGEGVAAQALDRLGVELEVTREAVMSIVGRGEQAPSGYIPFTPRAKRVLEYSLRESLQLGHSHIGPEHILLGLVREGEGVAAQVLISLGANLDSLREHVIELAGGPSETADDLRPIGSVWSPEPRAPRLVKSAGPLTDPTITSVLALLTTVALALWGRPSSGLARAGFIAFGVGILLSVIALIIPVGLVDRWQWWRFASPVLFAAGAFLLILDALLE